MPLNQTNPDNLGVPADQIPIMQGGVLAVSQFLAPITGALIQYYGQRSLQREAHKHNMELLKYQTEYNHPAAQMQRFLEAGLNPNLVYGQGTPGNIANVPRYPEISMPNLVQAFSSAYELTMRGQLMQAQTEKVRQDTFNATVRRELMQAQRDLVKANPYLDENVRRKLFDSLMAVADYKAASANWQMTMEASETAQGEVTIQPRGLRKVYAELNNLEQKYRLGQLDAKLKAEILQGKDWENDILLLEKKFLEDAEINPGHILMFLKLLVSRIR
nr:MAG TPA: DNA pilot protein VP2 [Microviridae sp.]